MLFGFACFAGASEPALSDLFIEQFRRGPLRADDIQITIDHRRDRGSGMNLKIEKIAIDAFKQTIDNLHGSCDALELDLRSIRCGRLQLALAINEQVYALTGSVEYKVATGMMRALFARSGNDAAQITVILDSRANDRRLEVEVDAPQLEIFSDMLPEFDIYAGALKLELGFYPGLHPRLDTAIGIRGLAWSNGDGTRAAEQAADRSIDEVRGESEFDSGADVGASAVTPLVHRLFARVFDVIIPAANAQVNFDTTSPASRALEQSLKKRFPKVKPAPRFRRYRADGSRLTGHSRCQCGAIESAQRAAAACDPAEHRLGKEIARINGHAERIDHIRQVFAKRWVAKADPVGTTATTAATGNRSRQPPGSGRL